MIELPAGFDEDLLKYADDERMPAQAVLRYPLPFPIDANGHVDVPSAVVSLPRNAFRGSTTLRSIALPAGLTSVGRNAFQGCSSLTSIELPASFNVDLLAKGLLKDASVPDEAVFHSPPAPAPPLSNRKAQIPEGAPNVTIDVPPGATRFEVFFYP